MIGPGINRIDGPLKVTGRAVYSYERQDAGQPFYGFIRGAAIGKGKITHIDTAEAEMAPGVRLVLTHRNVPKQGSFVNKPTIFDRPHPQLTSDRIEYFGQPVAFVVADTFEQARAAAALVKVSYAREDGAFDLATHADRAEPQATLSIGLPGETRFGDLDAAMSAGPVTIDQTYTTPYHFSQPMEPHACLADWRDNHLTVYLATQTVAPNRAALAETLGLTADQVTVDAAFVGGGFGSKLYLHAEAVLAALAARELAHPVKVALTRRQVFTLTGHRPEMIHRVRLAATSDGQLTGLGHDVNLQATEGEPWVEQAATVARSLYAAPNRLTRHSITNLDLKAAEAVRGPGELPGLLAFETAMDELAHALDIDPVELRLKNDTATDPERGVPLNGRRLADCLREGAKRFGWGQRPKTPGSRREGDHLVGYGMAAGIRMHFQGPTAAIVRIEPDGRVIVRSDTPDIGTGTYTIACQIAAEALGIGVNLVTAQLARSDFPPGAGAGGSWGASNLSIAVDRACQEIRNKIAEAAGRGAAPNDILADVGRWFPQGLEATGQTIGQAEDPNFKNYSQNTYGAAFAEVLVDVATGEIRLRRMTGVFAAGRIINAKTARSQLMGGMIWGVGSALHEAAHVDRRYGNWVNGDLAEYLMPVHADIPAIETVLLDDYDQHANHLGIKGVGELGVCGTGAAVSNAVFNATGIRVRDFPITLAKLLPGLPPMRTAA
ncbi:xanthine dehydrogenase family protein molybdopterin-binding subunit [Mesorhizobium sp. B2-3-5]|uniref:xanthine dehydrogenase family protein molybdopterin-binding subunit n=1 Tax=Mesorhizobium sp. B2-3-5 TaxID=2589958 RepID=UPI0011261F87|nr:xanthine dehydrogenase family protein molybdopterin-binding subunit [Mesorhizobium sp. B2-3-5]TPM19937.1 xanthine dehydrogenase family protein molybdopterin-binding subunit [Mesorhizobium sp. B2-3-5]